MSGTLSIPMLILIGLRRERTREVLDSIRRLKERNSFRNSHLSELTEIDDEPILSAWRGEDAILERHGLPRVHTDADGRFADGFLRYVLVERIDRACEMALEAGPLGRTTVVACFGCSVGNVGYRDALTRFGDRVLAAAAVLYVDTEADTPDALLRREEWNQFSSPDARLLSIPAANGPARRVPYAVIDPAADSADAPADSRVQEALDTLWTRWESIHRAAETDRLPGGSIRIVARDESHFGAHAEELLIDRSEVESIIRAELQRSIRGGSVRNAVRHSRPVGFSGLQRVRLGDKRSFWAPRPERTIPSHLIVGRRRRTRWLCFWGEWQDAETFVLHTFYAGKPAPREIHDPDASADELKRAVEFWSTHAIIVEESDQSERHV